MLLVTALVVACVAGAKYTAATPVPAPEAQDASHS